MKSHYLILFLLFILFSCKNESHKKSVNNTSRETISIDSSDQPQLINKDSIVNIDPIVQMKNMDTAVKLNSTIQFQSLDKLLVSAILYEIDKTSPVIVLCHQAGYNKYEYSDIALILNKRGFNCIAIDQRSGGEMKNAKGEVFVNETSIKAKEEGYPIEYTDAEQDIVAAIIYAKNKYKSPLILWGSSYSSTLALYIAEENNLVDVVVSFSPGNYLAKYKGSLIDKLPNLKKPMFITSSNPEAESIKQLLSKTTLGDNQVYFKPKGVGYHGSKALWPKQKGGEEYWNAIDAFLTEIKKTFVNKK